MNRFEEKHQLAKFDSRKNYFDGAGEVIKGCSKLEQAIKLAELDYTIITFLFSNSFILSIILALRFY